MSALAHAPQWSDRLAFDVALKLEGSGEPLKSILDTHKITKEVLESFLGDPTFKKRLEQLRTDIRENGLTFKLKAKSQAEDLLTTSWLLIHSPDVSPTVKADLIKSTVKWAGLEAKDVQDTTTSGGVTITINLDGGADKPKTIDVQAEEADADYT